MVDVIEIADRAVGPGQPCFIIAEAGVNHNGSMDMARRLIDAAVDAGADAVKFQTFKAERLATAGAPKAEYQERTTEQSESQIEMLRRLELTPEMHQQLIARCEEKNILFMSSFFDEDSADLLSRLDMAVFKIPSGEITNLNLLTHVARKGKPMIVSTGMSSLGEVDAAVRAVEYAGSPGFALLHCVSNYPADPADINLSAMNTMRAAFGTPVGYSDHTLGIEVALAAVAMGASIIEKHITLDHQLPGPDHLASLEPDEFRAMVSGIRTVESAIGNGRKKPAPSEAGTTIVGRKSLTAAREIPVGTMLTEEFITIKRPGTGLSPAMEKFILGRTTKVLIPADTLISLEMLV